MPLSTQNDERSQDKVNRLSPNPKKKMSDTPVIKTWTRLALGAMIYGVDMLNERARLWAEGKESKPAAIEKGMSVIVHKESKAAEQDAHSHYHQVSNKKMQTTVGVFFDAQNHISKNVAALNRVQRLADRITYPVFKGLRKQPLLRPFYRSFDRLVMRGQAELDRWEEIGQIEEERSRELLKTATLSAFDSSIDYLSTNPDIQDLVQVQSTSLLNDLIEEVRERAVSVNSIIEGWVRKTFGLIPRSEIPGPPPEVRRRAELFPTSNKRVP